MLGFVSFHLLEAHHDFVLNIVFMMSGVKDFSFFAVTGEIFRQYNNSFVLRVFFSIDGNQKECLYNLVVVSVVGFAFVKGF